jgi:hypothetical protein
VVHTRSQWRKMSPEWHAASNAQARKRQERDFAGTAGSGARPEAGNAPPQLELSAWDEMHVNRGCWSSMVPRR